MDEHVAAALLGLVVGAAIVLTWSLRPVWIDLYWHGIHNRPCDRRGCCR